MDVVLQALDGETADSAVITQCAALMRSNAVRLHLPEQQQGWTVAEHALALTDPNDRNLKFAIVARGSVVGRIDLNPVHPPTYAVGYWVDEAHEGLGHATRAVELVIEHATTVLAATNLYAGVSTGNSASVKVLERNGFVAVADLGDYDRFHLPLDGGAPRNP